jgi:hypothetical protein
MGEGMLLQIPQLEGGILLQNSRGRGPYLLQIDTYERAVKDLCRPTPYLETRLLAVGADAPVLAVNVWMSPVAPVGVRDPKGGWIEPGTGGMSVAPGSPWNLPNHRRPRSLGRGSTGHSDDRVYAVEEAPVIAERLAVRPDAERPQIHAFVEPASRMLPDAYESALAATRPAWKVVWPR